MPTKFADVDGVKAHLAERCHFDVGQIQEAPDLKVTGGNGLEASALDDPHAPEVLKEAIRSNLESQQGFRVETPTGGLQFVVSPFPSDTPDSSGVCCWIVSDKGWATLL